MQTSRLQLGLIATLAVGLGFSLASSQAVGYPMGPVISTGANPIVSAGGLVTDDSSLEIVSAPSDQDLILTDLILTSTTDIDCKRSHRNVLTLSSGTVMGQYETNSVSVMPSDAPSDGLSISHSFSSGIRIPAGESLSLRVDQTGQFGYCDSSTASYGVRYSVSGYRAQP